MKNKSVLHLFNHYLPQTENWAYHLIQNIPETSTLIAAKRYLKESFYNRDYIFYEHDYGELDKLYEDWGKEGTIGLIKKSLYKGSKLVFGDMRRSMLKFIEQQQVEVLHAHFADVGWYYHKIALRTNLPFVVSFYGWDYEMLTKVKPVFKKRIPQLFEIADAIVCEGTHGAETLVQKGCPRAKIHVVPLGVLAASIPFYHRAKKQGQLKLLQIASFTEKKGQHIAVQAIAGALPYCPGLTLTFVGGENQPGYRQSILREIAALGLQKVIEIKEHVDYASLHELMSDYDVFIHPSCHAENGDCEGGAPIVLLDAQATGMPIISTEHCDIPSEVIHNQTGFLCQENDKQALAKLIRQFYNITNQDYQEMAKSAQQHILTHYNIERNAIKLGELYEELLSS